MANPVPTSQQLHPYEGFLFSGHQQMWAFTQLKEAQPCAKAGASEQNAARKHQGASAGFPDPRHHAAHARRAPDSLVRVPELVAECNASELLWDRKGCPE